MSKVRIGIAILSAIILVVLGVLYFRTPGERLTGSPLERSLSVYGAAGLLNSRVLASRSATTTLESWCHEHGLAAPATVVATRTSGQHKPPTPQQRAELKVSADEPVRYRQVRLSCGQRTLSQAENWYVPGRLSEAMNAELDTTDTPFGKVVAPLRPTRTTLEMTLLWSVLPTGWEQADHAWLRDWARRNQEVLRHEENREMFRHTAVLTRESDDLPIAEVFETYTMGCLHFLTTR